MTKFRDIACIGAGYVGGPTMAMIAKKWPNRRVTVVDLDATRIAAWQSSTLPFYEPGLKETVAACLNRNLFFSTDIPAAIRSADIIFVSVNTPTKAFGQGAGRAADLQFWEKTAWEILEYATTDKIVVEKSTLPVKTATAMRRVLMSNAKGLHFEVLSNPEFLAEGSAIADLENPDRVLIGSAETLPGLLARDIIANIYARWVPRERIITTNVWSAELSKIAANAFLAQRISSINAISGLCEKTGADVTEVARAIGMDSRIGPKFLKAGVGFGGSCFKKDILNLVYMCETAGLQEEAAYWNAIVEMNTHQQTRFVMRMLANMFNTVSGKKIALLGFAFKADTSDTRETPALRIAQLLGNEHARVVISDPYALENARRDLRDMTEATEEARTRQSQDDTSLLANSIFRKHPSLTDRDDLQSYAISASRTNAPQISFEQDPYAAAREADAIAVLTDWAEYKTLDWQRIYQEMRKPAFLFDGRNILNHNALFQMGFHVFAVGKAPLSHFEE